MSRLRKFPLIKHFEFDDTVSYLYDARANILLKLKAEERDNSLTYLYEISRNERFNNGSATKSINHLFINSLQSNNVLLPGPLKQKIDTSEENIEQTILFGEKYVITKKLTLEITNQCNLRCKYCSYTINEKNGHGKMHGNKVMDFEIAKKAVDFYFERYTSVIRKIEVNNIPTFLKRNPPVIAFYGGEVLLQFNLLRKIVDYVKQLPWHSFHIKESDITFSISTNGTTLNQTIISFCTNNNILLFVSLDGPAEENDKNRVYKNGIGTAKKINANLNLIKEISKDYYINYVNILAVMAPNYDRSKVNTYFSSLSEGNHFAGVNVFNYLEFKDSCLVLPARKFPGKLFSISSFLKKNYCFDDIYLRIELNPLIHLHLKDLYEILIKINRPPPNGLFNGFNSCYIGYAGLFVDVNGKLHMCERTDFSSSIGDVDNGLRKNSLIEYYTKYFNQINSARCRNCWVHVFCKYCIGAMIKERNVELPSIRDCLLYKRVFEAKFKDLFLIFRKYPKVIDYMKVKFGNNTDISIIDFIDFMDENELKKQLLDDQL